MDKRKKIILRNSIVMMLLLLAGGLGSCSKSQSYSELLREEERAVNLFLSGQKVINEIPADSISFITGTDAPFYRLDEDGYLYMQVINKGDLSEKVQAGDLVYIRYEREDLKAIYLGYDTPYVGGNENNFSNHLNDNVSFVYKNQYLASTQTYGQGVQWPLKFLGFGCEVNLVLRSYYGFAEDMTQCVPYLINIKYFKPEY